MAARNLGAYQAVVTHGGIAAADPHKLIVMLMDGALERIAMARGAMQRASTAEKAQLLHRAVAIINELRSSLNLEAGGPLAANMADLYEYICRQLLKASLENRVELLDEVSGLIRELRGAWVAMPAEARKMRGAAATLR